MSYNSSPVPLPFSGTVPKHGVCVTANTRLIERLPLTYNVFTTLRLDVVLVQSVVSRGEVASLKYHPRDDSSHGVQYFVDPKSARDRRFR